jgi:hypothetical protein
MKPSEEPAPSKKIQIKLPTPKKKQTNKKWK